MNLYWSSTDKIHILTTIPSNFFLRQSKIFTSHNTEYFMLKQFLSWHKIILVNLHTSLTFCMLSKKHQYDFFKIIHFKIIHSLSNLFIPCILRTSQADSTIYFCTLKVNHLFTQNNLWTKHTSSIPSLFTLTFLIPLLSIFFNSQIFNLILLRA